MSDSEGDTIDLKSKRKARAVIKGQLTRVGNYIQAFDSLNGDLNAVLIKRRNLNELSKKYDKVQTEIEEVEDEEQYDRYEIDDVIFQLECKLNSLIDGLSSKKKQSDTGNLMPSPSGHINLKPIQLPVYSGKILEWQHFFSVFSDLVDSRSDISDLQKLHYLIASLREEPLSMIKDLPLSNESYCVAIQLLKDRFDNKLIIGIHHIENVLKIEPIKKESVDNISNFSTRINSNINSLEAMKLPVNTFELIVVQFLSSKLDSTSLKLWKEKISSEDFLCFKDFHEFLNSRRQLLENITANVSPLKQEQFFKNKDVDTRFKFQRKSGVVVNYTSNVLCCILCKKPHGIYSCEKFLAMSIMDREKEVKKLKLCYNCLSSNHKFSECKSRSCKKCNKKHNTLLHYVQRQRDDQVSSSPATRDLQVPKVVANLNSTCGKSSVLLSTAVVLIKGVSGEPHYIRVLLDSGSQSNFISERAVKKLGLHTSQSDIEVCGIGQSSTRTTQCTQCVIESRVTDFSRLIHCIVLKNITQQLPTANVMRSELKIPSNLQLADPAFHKTADVDLLIGAEYFFSILSDGQIKSETTQTVLQNTELGWVVTGRVTAKGSVETAVCCNLAVEARMDQQIQKFWELEEVNNAKKLMSSTEKECEEHFIKNVIRDSDGKFVVKLPLKDCIELGESKDMAIRRFASQERKFKTNPEYKERYISFMQMYEKLDHMERVPEQEEVSTKEVYYLPHHGVINEMSESTKLRVVFDGSAKSSNGTSLNDILKVGPMVQDDLFSILLRFRKYQYVFSADIEKMYRMVKVHKDHQDLQRIIWREDSSKPIEIFRLKTVTYGTASAPFLATRCLKQLAIDEEVNYPRAAETIENDFYVDDLLTGHDSLLEAKEIQKELIQVLHTGGFELRKWSANDPRLLEDIPNEHKHRQQESEELQPIKLLGVMWNSRDDSFGFTIKPIRQATQTKRQVLSQISSLFDPLGTLGPVILKAKVFMQRTWEVKIGWDDPLPEQLLQVWLKFLDELIILQSLSVPRKIFPASVISWEIHGFCDASDYAYGGVLYTRSVTSEGVKINLICSKSRVAPIRKVTLPRLELCAATLLGELLNKTLTALKLQSVPRCVLWSDSTVTLSWINSSSSQWKPFVANRVAQIHELTSMCEWKHVRSKDNPADHISRGLSPSQICTSKQWWFGPEWLKEDSSQWPQLEFTETDQERRKEPVITLLAEEFQFWSKYSSFSKLQRIIALCLRFSHNCRKSVGDRLYGVLKVSELKQARQLLIKQAQRERFSEELKTLERVQSVSKKSCLATLHPFIDGDKILRVGGRLSQATVKSSQKYPIVLPAKHALSDLIMKEEHIRNLHAGPQLLVSCVRTRYWPLNAKNTAKQIVRNCVTCFRVKPKLCNQLMGDLPHERVQPARAFINSGVDYCGPLLIRPNLKRKSTPVKAYIAVFVCFATKAIHLELAGDLTTQSFLGVLKRFMARRGRIRQLFSDNATNFTGAKRELDALRTLVQSREHQDCVQKWLSQEGIKWNMIPPRSPHFGGLWEAGVKSLKYHLRRTVGNSLHTYEELLTFLTQVEACLNSRPITSQSNDPNDLCPLTPGHFLIGEALTAPVEPDLQDIPMNRLTRWQLIQQSLQSFWTRWSVEYLTNLQQRVKWKQPTKQLVVGDLVIIKEDNLPPLRWKMGRILQVHPGKDGISRVATVKTASGIIRRAFTRLCSLPMESSDPVSVDLLEGGRTLSVNLT